MPVASKKDKKLYFKLLNDPNFDLGSIADQTNDEDLVQDSTPVKKTPPRSRRSTKTSKIEPVDEEAGSDYSLTTSSSKRTSTKRKSAVLHKKGRKKRKKSYSGTSTEEEEDEDEPELESDSESAKTPEPSETDSPRRLRSQGGRLKKPMGGSAQKVAHEPPKAIELPEKVPKKSESTTSRCQGRSGKAPAKVEIISSKKIEAEEIDEPEKQVYEPAKEPEKPSDDPEQPIPDQGDDEHDHAEIPLVFEDTDSHIEELFSLGSLKSSREVSPKVEEGYQEHSGKIEASIAGLVQTDGTSKPEEENLEGSIDKLGGSESPQDGSKAISELEEALLGTPVNSIASRSTSIHPEARLVLENILDLHEGPRKIEQELSKLHAPEVDRLEDNELANAQPEHIPTHELEDDSLDDLRTACGVEDSSSEKDFTEDPEATPSMSDKNPCKRLRPGRFFAKGSKRPKCSTSLVNTSEKSPPASQNFKDARDSKASKTGSSYEAPKNAQSIKTNDDDLETERTITPVLPPESPKKSTKETNKTPSCQDRQEKPETTLQSPSTTGFKVNKIFKVEPIPKNSTKEQIQEHLMKSGIGETLDDLVKMDNTEMVKFKKKQTYTRQQYELISRVRHLIKCREYTKQWYLQKSQKPEVPSSVVSGNAPVVNRPSCKPQSSASSTEPASSDTPRSSSTKKAQKSNLFTSTLKEYESKSSTPKTSKECTPSDDQEESIKTRSKRQTPQVKVEKVEKSTLGESKEVKKVGRPKKVLLTASEKKKGQEKPQKETRKSTRLSEVRPEKKEDENMNVPQQNKVEEKPKNHKKEPRRSGRHHLSTTEKNAEEDAKISEAKKFENREETPKGRSRRSDSKTPSSSIQKGAEELNKEPSLMPSSSKTPCPIEQKPSTALVSSNDSQTVVEAISVNSKIFILESKLYPGHKYTFRRIAHMENEEATEDVEIYECASCIETAVQYKTEESRRYVMDSLKIVHVCAGKIIKGDYDNYADGRGHVCVPLELIRKRYNLDVK